MPDGVIAAALQAMAANGVVVIARSPTIPTPPLGPGGRRFANAAALIESDQDPARLLVTLKAIECRFGRRAGRRWGARVLDLDIILWSGGTWSSPGLRIPHAAFPVRDFVLCPLVAIAPAWRDPVTGLTMRHLAARLNRAKPVDPARTAA